MTGSTFELARKHGSTVDITPPPASTINRPMRLGVLDGWRGISILCVLAAHLLPLGPSNLRLNECIAALGMALFFTLSGFLITSTLIHHPSTRDFLIRRVCRIVPLAWTFIFVALLAIKAPLRDYPPHLVFYANLPPFWLTPLTGHLWSLCVEMQFYMLVALLFGLFGKRGLFALPFLGLLVTLGRILTSAEISIVSYKRADEIFAGCILALAYVHLRGRTLPYWFRLLPIVLLPATVIACHPASGPMNYLRPYLASSLIGVTLFCADSRIAAWLQTGWLKYLADNSYALYVIHPIVMHGWFDPPSKLLKYARRPLGLAISFTLAHISTTQYESRWISLGKRLTNSRKHSMFSKAASPMPQMES